MKEIIGRISDEFLQEALSSPRMLEDLASMEKYMSESYDGRTFVELIQNADDAGANRIKVDYSGDSLIVCNDGRSFDNNDIMAICRSGSSNKERGKNIGYRGVGFKSATTISTDIIIHSSDTFFTFSKSKCAQRLNVAEEKVPTVRIPFLYDEDELGYKIVNRIEELEAEGFTTFFIFLNAKINKFKHELDGFGSGWLLFLRNLCNIEISLPQLNQACKVKRKNIGADILVKVVGKSEQWYIVNDHGVSIAFRYNNEKGIIPCGVEDAVFHCFLPTMDKTGFPFKVNADFSTDPSRKHIITDNISNTAIESIADVFVKFLIRVTGNQEKEKVSCLNLLSSHFALGDLVSHLENDINTKLRNENWVKKNNNVLTSPQNVLYFPRWVDEDDQAVLLNVLPAAQADTYDKVFYSDIDKIGTLISRFGAKEIAAEIFQSTLMDADKAKHLNEKLAAKIFIYCFRGAFSNKSKMDNVFVPTTIGFVSLNETSNSMELSSDFATTILTILSTKEIDTLRSSYQIFTKKTKASVNRIGAKATPISPAKKQMAINKWKTPIQNCMAVESMSGRTGKDVSRKCNEYAIESVDARGDRQYIAIKQVKALGDSFSLSEKEYAAAQRLGDAYKVFVISTESDQVDYMYIQNPVDTVKLQKIVKEWEFLCDAYETPEKLENDTGNDLLDQRLVKCLLPEYFNSAQRGFLKDFCSVGSMNYEDSLLDMVDKINSVVDFYSGDKLFEVKDGKISAEKSKINSIRKILEDR